MKIGDVKLDNNLFLAPLAGLTFNAYRILCKDYGAGLTYAPMINTNALINNPDKSIDILPIERPIAVQLMGKDALKLGQAARIVEPSADIIDLNCGCPRKREMSCGYGSALLRRPKKLAKLIETMVKSVSIPVTIKLRLGNKDINVLEVAKLVEEAGASALTVHARRSIDDYSVRADWTWIKKVKEAINIPVIGNGDVFNPVDVKKMFEQTGCDAVMIGRGANGNPYIFRDTLKYLRSGVLEPINPKEKVDILLKFLDYCSKYGVRSFAEVKAHAYWFTKGLKGAAKMRRNILASKTEAELRQVFKAAQ